MIFNLLIFIDCVIEKFPFRFHTIRTDRVPEFQAQFHWHIEDNTKVERSLRTDQEEFHQLLTRPNDVDINEKLVEWERLYNMDRLHGAFKGKTPNKAMGST